MLAKKYIKQMTKLAMVSSAGLHSHSYDSSLVERLLFRVARKWIAGYDKQAALACAEEANRKGMEAILNFLGEDTTDPANISTTVDEYLGLLDAINSKHLAGCVSIKPTQVGLTLGYDLCLENSREIIAHAKALGQFVWFDIESAKFVNDTISVYLRLLKEYGMIGIAIQAYLRQSESDILRIIENRGRIRLVKGAYHEPEEIAFTTKQDVDENYSRLLQILFDSETNFAVATHDSNLIDQAVKLAAQHPNAKFEFQMLMGIRDDVKPDLVAKGYRLSEYIPYGSHWLPYSVRRLRERKRNILLLARSLVQ